MNLMTPEILKQIRTEIKDDSLIKFYHSKQWQVVRHERLRLDHYECQLCKAQGKHTRSTTVHHIEHVRDKPILALELKNTETICRMHHNMEHPEKLQEFHKDKFENQERW